MGDEAPYSEAPSTYPHDATMKFPTLALILALCLALIDAQTLMYVDDQDPRIMYIPQSSWTIVEGIDGDFGGDHMLTQDPNAFATIDMTFISFSFVSAKWPYPVTTDVSVDGEPPTTIDLQDYDSPDVGTGPSTVKAGVVWTFNGTVNEAHSVKISVPPDGPGYAVLDALIFEGIFPLSSTSTAIQTTTATVTTLVSTSTTIQTTATFTARVTTTLITAPSSSSSGIQDSPSADLNGSTSHKSHNTAIIAGIICSFAGVLFLFFLWRFYVRRQRRRSANAAITVSRPLQSASSMGGFYNQGDGADAYGPASQPQMLESGVANPQASAVAPSYGPSAYRNWQGGDGLASAAESVVGGTYPGP